MAQVKDLQGLSQNAPPNTDPIHFGIDSTTSSTMLPVRPQRAAAMRVTGVPAKVSNKCSIGPFNGQPLTLRFEECIG